ncbi:MAG: acyltransferase family protein [Kiritimatiellia bacterium]
MNTTNGSGSGRLCSLDALRGLDMLMITGLGPLLIALCQALGFGDQCWLARQLHHVPWHGFRIEDGIFPLFLFIAGVSFPFSLARQRERGLATGRIVARIVWRGLALVFFGLLWEGLLRFDFATLRIPSVLALIGCSWAAAALLYVGCGRVSVRVAVCACLLVGYAALMLFVQAPDFPSADRFSPEGNVICWLDRVLTGGHTYREHFDPEGFPRILTAMVTASLGMFAGDVVRRGAWSGNRRTAVMLALGVALAAVGGAADAAGLCPVNKALWSPSFVLLAGGCSFVAFALFYWIVDVRGWRRWTFVLRVVGMNSITIYLAQRMLGFRVATDFFFGGAAGLCGPAWGAVVTSFGHVAVCWLFLYFLYRRKVFLKV